MKSCFLYALYGSSVHLCCRNDILLLLDLKAGCDACDFEYQSLKYETNVLFAPSIFPIIHPPTQSSIHLPNHPSTYPIIHPPTQSSIHLPNHPFSYRHQYEALPPEKQAKISLPGEATRVKCYKIHIFLIFLFFCLIIQKSPLLQRK